MKKIPAVQTLHHILILRGEGSLGDAVLSSACYREIKKANPQIKITVACFGSAYEYFLHYPYVDEVFKLPIRRIIRPNQRWVSLILAALKLRKRHFDLVLDSSYKPFWNWRLFKKIAGGGRVLDNYTSPVQPFGAPSGHSSEHEAAILKLLGIADPNPAYELPVPADTQQAVALWLARQKCFRYLLLNPSGSVAARSFRAETLRELCAALRRLRLPFVVPAMASKAEELRKIFSNEKDVFVKQTDNVFELFELVRRSVAVLTPDTSVVHIATGFERPTLAFYNALCTYNAPHNPKAAVLETDPADVNVFDWWHLERRIDELQKWL